MVAGLRWPWDAETQPPRMPKYSPRRYSVGVDLGQASDFTAVAVLEKTIVPPQTAMFSPVGESPSNRLVEGDIVYDLVYLKRPKLGTPYDTIAKRVADLICELEPQGAFGELGQVTLSVAFVCVIRVVVPADVVLRLTRQPAAFPIWLCKATLTHVLPPLFLGVGGRSGN